MQRFCADNDKHPLSSLVGCGVFIRTVTYHLVGQVHSIKGDWMILNNSSWVADSGRFMQALQKGTLSEVEPCGDAFVNLNAVTDIFPWNHALPTDQK